MQLFKCGEYIFAKDNSGRNALDYAYNDDVKKILMDYATDSVNPTEILFNAVEYRTTTSKRIQELVKSGANVNAKDEYGFTILMRAALNNPNPDVITALINCGADVNAKNDEYETALMLVADSDPKMVKALIAGGADVNTRQEFGVPVLSHAAGNFDTEIVKMLLAAGADVNAQDEQGYTALMMVALSSYGMEENISSVSDVIKILLSAGADIKIKNKEGQTALDCADEKTKKKYLAL